MYRHCGGAESNGTLPYCGSNPETSLLNKTNAIFFPGVFGAKRTLPDFHTCKLLYRHCGGAESNGTLPYFGSDPETSLLNKTNANYFPFFLVSKEHCMIFSRKLFYKHCGVAESNGTLVYFGSDH